ncbi:MAG: PQQ-binding-like beta-propeller repeat protein [Anaeromyxobacter sp.]|nr:PQQ-binding-like beta-propeller repeat protein [Anaeromyxobacter sp.]MBL0277010.1 PQQ-binding-like beta-propeller repeat protein [Anaeromyxobacter sp.]
MRRTLIATLLLATLVAACGAVEERPRCSAPGTCPAGQYCAPEGICWRDDFKPAIDAIEVLAASPTPRDGQITVKVRARDDRGLAGVSVKLDLQPDQLPAATFDGTDWVHTFDLAALPFPYFERAVELTAVAIDEAGNSTQQVAVVRPTVTRLRWVYEGGANMTPVAVLADGSVIAGLGASANQLVRVSAAGAKEWEATVGSLAVAGAPAVGLASIAVSNQSGRAFMVGLDGSVQNGSGCDTTLAIQSGPAVGADGVTAYFGSDSGAVFAVDAGGRCMPSGGISAVATTPAIRRDGSLSAASGSLLRSLTPLPGLFQENWNAIPPNPPPPSIGLDLDLPLAIDATDRVWTYSTDGNLNVTTAAGVTSTVKTLAGPAQAAPIILADGSLVLGDATNRLHRLSATGAALWASPPDLGAQPLTALALAGGEAVLLVPTFRGSLHALRVSDGSTVWSAQLTTGLASLRPGNVHTAPGAGLSLAYFPSSSGKLYAVVVDGHLDAAAPWPKVFHDTRNTGNAAAPLP